MIGSSLGPYKIIEQLGAGGMGEVYLGEDTRLGRKVAIKVLPAEFASDPERLARFEQEARAAAALNHPHIAVVHDIGTEGETHFMVQEYLEGETLREPLNKMALPLSKALDLAGEIAEALRAAHEAGIIHRDLKPENIFITKDGHAKVLDFGLAKLTELATPGATGISMSPTVLGTVAGQVMGTAGYMSPEQVEGEGEIDARADVFAFGCVLYEMVGGKRAFGGKSVLDTLHAIARTEPQPLGEIKPDLPADLHRTIRKCLAKDPDRRYQGAAEVIVDLRQLQDDIAAGTAASAAAVVAAEETVATIARPGSGLPLRIAAPLAVVLVLVAAAATFFATRSSPAPLQVARFDVQLPEDVLFSGTGRRYVAVSPDGSRVVFVGQLPDGGTALWMRFIDDRSFAVMPNTEGARAPFFSPDGQQIGFWQSGQLKRIAVTGGAAVPLGSTGNVFGADWADDGTIYFGRASGEIAAVPETGGAPRVVIGADQGQRAHGPQLLPGGEWLLFTVAGPQGSWNDGSIAAQHLSTGERRELLPGGTDGHYLSSGHLVYWRDATLFAVPFDAGTLEVTPGPVSVLEGVQGASVTGAGQFAISKTGSMVYVEGSGAAGAGEILVWVDEAGDEEPLSAPSADYFWLRVSPDGSKVAATVLPGGGTTGDIYIYDLASGAFERRSYGEADLTPIWSADGSSLAFASAGPGNGDRDIWVTAADGSSEQSLLFDDPELRVYPLNWAADGSMLVMRRAAGGTGEEGLYTLDAAGERLEPVVDTEFIEMNGRLSPDGAWLAYTSDDAGYPQVFVRAWPGPSGRWAVSPGQGDQPVWSPDGGTVYYGSEGSMWAADVQLDNTPVVTGRRQLFDLLGYTSLGGFGTAPYDIDPVTGRFLMLRRQNSVATAEPASAPHLTVILNWFEELKERVPTGR